MQKNVNNKLKLSKRGTANPESSRKFADMAYSQTSDIHMYRDKDSEEQNIADINSQTSISLG